MLKKLTFLLSFFLTFLIFNPIQVEGHNITSNESTEKEISNLSMQINIKRISRGLKNSFHYIEKINQYIENEVTSINKDNDNFLGNSNKSLNKTEKKTDFVIKELLKITTKEKTQHLTDKAMNSLHKAHWVFIETLTSLNKTTDSTR